MPTSAHLLLKTPPHTQLYVSFVLAFTGLLYVLHSEHLAIYLPLPLLSAGSAVLGCSTGVTSAVFFAGLLAGVALAGPAGVLSVVCYHWKKRQAKTKGK